MSLYIKKHWSKGAKIAGAVFFAVLMFVNIKLTTDPNASGDIDLLGLKLSLFTPSVVACGSCNGRQVKCETHTICIDGHCFTVTTYHNIYT